ncbi:Hypothetical protein PFCIRM527_11095 [Propionibacterium freudenreichii]|nr:Hypothetical protein PFCIRM512_07375 [Propionibacterium freudenreichii]CEI31720.1 Hypothetical protein PFCIRM527_11095 [Propionibacterium freudenreichii]
MEALNPREDEEHGSTEEVPRRASGESHEDGSSVTARSIDEVGNVSPCGRAARDQS